MKTITNLVYNFVRKQLAKNNMGQGKGITSLPNSMDIEIGMTNIYNNLRKGGFDAVSAGKAIKSEDDLARTLSEIKQKEISDQQFFNQDPNRLDIIMDKMNKGIPLNEGDRFALEGSGFRTDMDAFKGFEPKVIQGGKSKGIEKLLESGDVKKGVAPKTTKETIKRKSMIDPKLTQEENIKNIMEENKAAAKRLEEKMKDPDKKAEGGRTGYFKGGVINAIKNLLKKQKSKKTGDKIYGVGGEEIDVADFKKSLGLDEATDKKSMEDLEKKLQMIIGRDRTKHAEGGLMRLGFENGSPPSIKLFPRAQGKITDQKAGAGGNAPNITLRDIDYGVTGLIKDDRFFGGAEIDKGKVKIDVTTPGGDTLFKDTISKKDAVNFILGLGDPEGDKFQIKADEGLNNINLVVRKKFQKGSPPSKGRRNFLKLMGGLAALPVVGKFFKFAKPTSTAVQAAKEAKGVPSYFPKLVEKIKLLGDDVTSARATGERQVVKEYKGYELTEEMDTGKLTIKRDNYTSEEYLDYTPGGQYYDETRKKVIKYPDSYEEVTVKPDAEGKMKDVDFGLDSYDDILDEVGESKIKKAGGGLAYMLGM